MFLPKSSNLIIKTWDLPHYLSLVHSISVKWDCP
jgi:hypothetical protein